MKTIIRYILGYIGKYIYENRDDLYRYALNILKSHWKDILFVVGRKFGVNIKLENLTKSAVIVEETIPVGANPIEYQEIKEAAIYTIDQGLQVYTLYACVPTSLYLNYCRVTQKLPVWQEYMDFLKHCEDSGKWNPRSGANVRDIGLIAEEYFNNIYKNKLVKLEGILYKDSLEILSKGYIATLTHKNNINFVTDRMDNSIIDKDNYAGASEWGHCIRGSYGKNFDISKVKVVNSKGVVDYTYDNDVVKETDNDIVLIDNYPDKKKQNSFYIHNRLEAHMNSGLFSSYLYFFKPLFELNKEATLEDKLGELSIKISPEVYKKSIEWIGKIENKEIDSNFFENISKMDIIDRVSFDIAYQYKTGLLKNFDIEKYRALLK